MKYLPGLPWSATETPAGKGKVVDAQGFSVASCNGANYDESRRHAEFISHAANIHHDIVGALDDLVKIADLSASEVYDDEPLSHAIKIAKDVLGRARRLP